MTHKQAIVRQMSLAEYSDATMHGLVFCTACDGWGYTNEEGPKGSPARRIPCPVCLGHGRKRRTVEITVTDFPLG